jgi:RNA polymerase sigma factor (sigma-70 family)
MAIASKKEILEHLDSIDLNELLDRMENYVRTRFYNKSEKEREGFDYLDFCYNVLIKASTGVRNWDKKKTSFDKFIFGSLRSDLYNFFRKQKNKKNEKEDLQPTEQEIYLIEVNEFIELDEVETEDEPPDVDFKDISQDALKSLREQGADKLEIEVFECWLAGYYKPKEIAELCDTDTENINNAVKRLSRKTIKLKEKWISLIK